MIYIQREKKRGSFKIAHRRGIEKREEIFGMRSKIGQTESGKEKRGERGAERRERGEGRERRKRRRDRGDGRERRGNREKGR